MENGIIIGTNGWEDYEVEELVEIVGKENFIKREEVEQYDFGISLAIAIGIFFAGAIAGGIGNSIGKDIWEKLKSKFVKRAEEKKHSAINFRFKNEKNLVSLNLKTEDPKIIEKAFDTVELALQKVSTDEQKSSFFFDNNKESWIKIEKGKFIKTIAGIAGSTGTVRQGDKVHEFTVEELEEHAKRLPGSVLNIGHMGKQIGEITKAYVKDDKLMYEAGIYEGTSKEDLEEMEKIIKSGGGVSLGFSR